MRAQVRDEVLGEERPPFETNGALACIVHVVGALDFHPLHTAPFHVERRNAFSNRQSRVVVQFDVLHLQKEWWVNALDKRSHAHRGELLVPYVDESVKLIALWVLSRQIGKPWIGAGARVSQRVHA